MISAAARGIIQLKWECLEQHFEACNHHQTCWLFGGTQCSMCNREHVQRNKFTCLRLSMCHRMFQPNGNLPFGQPHTFPGQERCFDAALPCSPHTRGSCYTRLLKSLPRIWRTCILCNVNDLVNSEASILIVPLFVVLQRNTSFLFSLLCIFTDFHKTEG